VSSSVTVCNRFTLISEKRTHRGTHNFEKRYSCADRGFDSIHCCATGRKGSFSPARFLSDCRHTHLIIDMPCQSYYIDIRNGHLWTTIAFVVDPATIYDKVDPYAHTSRVYAYRGRDSAEGLIIHKCPLL